MPEVMFYTDDSIVSFSIGLESFLKELPATVIVFLDYPALEELIHTFGGQPKLALYFKLFLSF